VILAASLSTAYGELLGISSVLLRRGKLDFRSRWRFWNRQETQKLGLNTIASLLVFGLALGSIPRLQAQSDDHPYRRVVHSQKPAYPELLKILSIGGTVRLKVKVLANGTVANAEILGGDPILAESAVRAVMAWKYTPALSTTVEIATIDFNSR
jgi:TonB family protein